MADEEPFEDPEARKARERARAVAWIQEKWTADRTCPICSTNQWGVTEAVELRLFSPKGLLHTPNAVYPAFQVWCQNCGFTHIFNALISGVVEPGSEPDDKGSAS